MSDNIKTNASPDYNRIAKLSDEEIKEPYLVIYKLFDFGHFPDIKQMLWDSFKATITGTYSKNLSREERYDIVILYEYLEKLIEASYIINERRKLSKASDEVTE